MTGSPRLARLPDHGVLSLSGEDAGRLLQGVVTADVESLAIGAATYAGLLTPQGKVLCDFLVVNAGPEYLIDVLGERAGDLAKRLQLYRLRARAEIKDRSAELGVAAIWGEGADRLRPPGTGHLFADPRRPELGMRLIAPTESLSSAMPETSPATADDYHAHRIAVGVPEGGRDWVFGDTFAHDALFDQLGGVSFTKGCYVGQEIVSRMQHRGTARRRIVQVSADRPLPETAADITAGGAVIGRLGSVAGRNGLAMVRLDRLAEALARGEPILAGELPIAIGIPAWATFALSAPAPQEAP